MSGIAISFAGNSLQTSNIITNTITHAGLPTKRAQTYALSHANASVLPFVEYPSKPITISGQLVDDDITDMDSLIDTFNSYLVAQNGELNIGYAGSTRQYICTATAMTLDRPGNLSWANFSVTFTCTQPFGQDTSSTTILSTTGRTLASYSDDYTFEGSAPYQLPVVTITLTAVSDSNGGTIIWGNGGTGQAITTVSRTWSNGDVLTIDCNQQIVMVNDSAINFSGAFPTFEPGAQVMTYSDNFTSRTFSIVIDYVRLWL